jgi:hypothetical protein
MRLSKATRSESSSSEVRDALSSAHHLLGNLVALTSIAVLAHIQCIYIEVE